MSADNQQERFIRLGHYLAGFTDGEGSFNISFRKRDDYSAPWKVSLCFNVSQKEFEILKLFQKTLGCGTLRSRPDGIWYYEVNTLRDILNIIIPYFRKFPFRSKKKQRDFQKFCDVANLMDAKKHNTLQGIREIAVIRDQMNDGGKRKFSTQIILKKLDEYPQRLYAKVRPSRRT